MTRVDDDGTLLRGLRRRAALRERQLHARGGTTVRVCPRVRPAAVPPRRRGGLAERVPRPRRERLAHRRPDHQAAVESDLDIAGGIVGRVIETLEWPRPVRAGDTLTVRSEVLDVSTSRSRPGGKVRMRSETVNQHGEVVQVMTALLLVPSR